MKKLREKLALLIRSQMKVGVVDTQVKVASRAGVSQSTVQRLLSLEQAATVDLLESLAKAFGVKHAEHLLLDPDDSKLLNLWSTLSEEDRGTVLGFIQMKAQTKPVPDAVSQLSFETQTPVSHGMRAASKRASAREPEHLTKVPPNDKNTSTRARREA